MVGAVVFLAVGAAIALNVVECAKGLGDEHTQPGGTTLEAEATSSEIRRHKTVLSDAVAPDAGESVEIAIIRGSLRRIGAFRGTCSPSGEASTSLLGATAGCSH
jgi:hypothetical protein